MFLLSLLLFLVHGSLLINHSHVSSCVAISGRATIVRYAWQRTHLFASWLTSSPPCFICVLYFGLNSLNHQVHFEGGSHLVI